MNNQQKCVYKIHGMHCASCEILIERKFKKIPGVEKVSVSHASGKAEVYYREQPKLQALQEAVKPDGYAVTIWGEKQKTKAMPHKNTSKDYFQMGGIFLILFAVYYLLKQFNLVPNIGIQAHMGYGVIFLIGLFAAMSTCIAVVGGLLLAVAEKYSEVHPELTSAQRFRPHLYFNVGRIVGYTLFGTLVGGLGSVLTLSAKANGYLIILVSVVMLSLGFQLLHLFPWMRRFSPKLPKFLSHKIHDLSTKDSKAAPFALGSLTFFLPCGFTQALQLYVLATGNWKVGAITMLVFSLGTLPALLSLSAISSFAKGAVQRNLFKFAGVLIVMLAIFNIKSGLTLAGFNIDFVFASKTNSQTAAPNAPLASIVDGKQVIQMKVDGLTYAPHTFTVTKGVPVEWQIDGANAGGCAQVLLIPKLQKTQYLAKDSITTIAFTPTETGDIPFSCSMGMTTRGSKITVVDNTSSSSISPSTPQSNSQVNNANADAPPTLCDSTKASCPTQQLQMDFSYNQRGYSPRYLTAKLGKPVELIINAKDDPGGCMGTIIAPASPKLGIAASVKTGLNTLTFTPTETGVVRLTCSMGVPIVDINIES